jgi:hypothetical protein
LKKIFFILIAIVCFTSYSSAAGTKPWSVPKINGGNIDYVALPANSKMLIVHPLAYGSFVGSYYPSYVFTKAELEKIKNLDSKANYKNIKMIDCNGAIGQGFGYVCSGHVYKDNVLLKQALCYKFDGSATMSAGVLIYNITFIDDEAYGDIYVYNRVSIAGMPAQLVGKQLPLKDYKMVAGSNVNPGNPGSAKMGAVSCTYYYEPTSIKGEITATQNNVPKRAVKVGEKVDINWKAEKN